MNVRWNALTTLLVVTLLGGACVERETLVLFGTELRQRARAEVFTHAPHYLHIVHLDQIYQVRIPAEESADALRRILAAQLPGGYDVSRVVSVFVYTTDTDTAQVDIGLDETHAMSVIRQQDGSLVHDYFERQGNAFVQLPELTADVTAGLDMDDVRLLHFASSPGDGLPATSTLFEFRMEPAGEFTAGDDVNTSIGDTLLMSMRLNKGLNTLDVYGSDFVKVMMRDNPVDPGKIYCGNSEACGAGSPDDSCLFPPAGPEGPARCVSSGSGCCNQVLVQARAMSEDGTVPFDFAELFDFKDGFVMSYPKTREYLAYFYLVGRHMKMDPASMKNYIDATIQISRAMKALQGSDDAAVIVDDEFISVFTTFSQNHMGTGSKDLDAAMRTMQAEMMPMRGATRAEVVRYLEDEEAFSSRQTEPATGLVEENQQPTGP